MKKILVNGMMLLFIVSMLCSMTSSANADIKKNNANVIPVAQAIESFPKPTEHIPIIAIVEELPEPEVDESEVDMLACVIYQEAGSDVISDETRYMVGDVVLNRVADERFPNTIKEVLTQKNQYGRFYWTGIVWPEKIKYECEKAAVERARKIARELLTDTYHSKLYENGYVWQAGFIQGCNYIACDGIYFGK